MEICYGIMFVTVPEVFEDKPAFFCPPVAVNYQTSYGRRKISIPNRPDVMYILTGKIIQRIKI